MKSVIGSFFKERRLYIAGIIGAAAVSGLVFFLYDVPASVVQYAFLLAVVWVFLLGCWDFIRYNRRHRLLQSGAGRIENDAEELPGAEGLLEQDYQKIVRELYEKKTEIESKSRISRQEMSDYYAMWVHQIKTPIAALQLLIQTCEAEITEGYLKDRAPEDRVPEDRMPEDRTSKDRAPEDRMPEDRAPKERVLEEQSADSRTLLKEMRLELFKIEQYVGMVLTYLRMEDMSSDMTFDVCSLDEIVRQAVRKYSQMFILQKIKLNYEPLEVKVLTDEKWLVFVLEQILSNALKYTKQGSISIYMQKGKLVVEDTGIGIWQEDLPRVFERGFTGYNGREDKKSTGIGLYLCKMIMQKLCHRIWIESEPGQGTRVLLDLSRKELHVE